MRIIVLLLAGWFAFRCPAQTGCGTGSEKQIRPCLMHYENVVFTPAEGEISLTVPTNAAVGEHISARVSLLPKGSTEAEKADNLKSMTRYRIYWSGQTAGAGEPVIRWVVNRQIGDQMCLLEAGEGIPLPSHKRLSEVCRLVGLWYYPLPARDGVYIPELHVGSVPLAIPGRFNGDVSRIRVLADGQPVTPLAASEREILVESPANAGLHEIAVSDIQGRETRQVVRFLDIHSTPSSFQYKSGKVYVGVTVSGLERLARDRPIILTMSPQRYDKLSFNIGSFSANLLLAHQITWRIWPRPRRTNVRIVIGKDFVDVRNAYSFNFVLSVSDRTPNGPRRVPVLNSSRLDAAVLYQFAYPSPAETEVTAIRNSIVEWSADNSVEVEDAARAAIVKDFSSRHGNLMEAYSRWQEQFTDYYSFLRVFTRMYLYEVAERQKPAKTGNLAGRAFWDSRAAAGRIRFADVAALIVDQFYGIWASLTTSKSLIEIASKPPRMWVSLDRDTDKESDPLTNGKLALPVNRPTTVRVYGGGKACTKSVQFSCPGYHGALICQQDTGQFDNKTYNSCAVPTDRRRLETANR